MNPYEHWLGIKLQGQKLDYFLLLGLPRTISDPAAIKTAAERQLNKLRPYESSEHAETCQKLHKQIQKAYQILSNPQSRINYLDQLEAISKSSGKPNGKAATNHTAASPAQTNSSLSSTSLQAGRSIETPTRPSSHNNSVLIGGIIGGGVVVSMAAIAFFWLAGSSDSVQVAAMQDSTSARTPDVSAEPATESVLPHKELSAPTSNESAAPNPSAEPPMAKVEPKKTQQSAKAKSKPRLETTPNTTVEPSNLDAIEAVASTTAVADGALQPLEEEPVTTTGDVVQQTHNVFTNYCHRCHGNDGQDEGGFDFVLNRDKLVSAGYVLPRAAKQSLLYERLVSHTSPMPPEGEQPRPSPTEIAAVRDWIRTGAENFNHVPKQLFVSPEQQFDLILADLNTVKQRERPYIRYFSVTHLGNAGYSAAEIATYRRALAKLLNSLSWNRQLAGLRQVKNCSTLFRIDLRDLKWSSEQWKLVLAYYPYALVRDTRQTVRVRSDTKSDLPVIRADWFVAAASRPPLYHDLLQLPKTDRELERLLQVDIEKNIDEGRVVRAAFARSGVSQNNRMIERHESMFGAYWRSYDFASSTGRQNLFEFPLGPGNSIDHFEHDGGEMIFRLPNGMLGFMLVDALGSRIDKGPTEIVSDPLQPDRVVVNGVSCMSCHYGGFIPKKDEIREHVTASSAAYPRFEDILQLYPESNVADELLTKDTQEYQKALAQREIDIEKPTQPGEPIHIASSRYFSEIDLQLAAAELGLTSEDFRRSLDRIDDRDLTRRVGALKIPGGVLKREAFNQVFLDLVVEFDLGYEVLVAEDEFEKQLAKRKNIDQSKAAFVPRGRPGAAEEAISAGLQALEDEDWDFARHKLEQAITFAPDLQIKLKACELIIPLYERHDSIEKLVEAHKVILDASQSTASITKAHDELYHSIISFLQKQENIRDWRFRSIQTGTIDWRSVEFPLSVAHVIESTFEADLKLEPRKESALRVLYSFYAQIREENTKRKAILLTLQEIYSERGERLDHMALYDLAHLYNSTGEHEEAAEIFHQMNQATPVSSRNGLLLLQEAKTWAAANKREEALTAMKQAEKAYSINKSSSGHEFIRLGDLYVELDQPKAAAAAYKLALKSDIRGSRIAEVQAKLTSALAASNGGKREEVSYDELLDPLHQYRQAAEEAGRRRSTDARSDFRNMFTASENWLQAEELKKAALAANKAERALRRVDKKDQSSHHAELAHLFLDLEQDQSAFKHFVDALKLAVRDSDIENYQREVAALVEENETIQRTPEIEELLDKNYKFRLQARHAEAKDARDASQESRNLIEAVKLWRQAGDQEQVVRCGKLVEDAIKQIGGSRLGGYSDAERRSSDLAEIYLEAGMEEAALRQYVAAMDHSTDDERAVKYYKQIQSISQRSKLPLPSLDKATEAKLDPLNRFRTQALEDEAKAAKLPRRAVDSLLSAAKNWAQAKEVKKATKLAQRVASEIAKDEKGRSKDRSYENLAKLYVELKMNTEAIKYYQHAMEATSSKYSKEEYQENIDNLREEN